MNTKALTILVMKKHCFFLFMILISSFQSFSQSGPTLSFNKNGWQAWVTSLDGSKSDRGFFWKIESDSVYLALSDAKKVESMYQIFQVKGYSIQNIESIELKKVKAGKKGMVIGVVLGYFTGFAISLSTGETTPNNSSWFPGSSTTYDIEPGIGGLVGAVAGGAIGAVIGSNSSKSFRISGNLETYNKSILELDERAFWNRVKKR